MPAAGKYREQIAIYLPYATLSDGLGGRVLSGVGTSFTVWARVQALPAKEDLIDGKITYRQPFKVSLRYDEQISNTSRIEWNGKRISINSVVVNERKTEMQLLGVLVK
ncbi:phage head closure protein [Hymenobacter canadensis]|uniref:Phage head closure protein n=1 Tax=Hymenobacter canadensis TaxID=2999067 RepID=A0ABY7LTI4_9BACT|nr:phage head closure protein [Hymenobacter canadensis]WBA43169.1 phage head closure protein [Hymenobacter canadensis]